MAYLKNVDFLTLEKVFSTACENGGKIPSELIDQLGVVLVGIARDKKRARWGI